MAQARARLASAGVDFVEVDTAGLGALNDKVSFPVALHEPIADIPAYLAATGVTGIGVREIAAAIASPDVKGAFGAIQGDAIGPGYPDAIRVHRPQLQRALRRLLRRQPARGDDVPDHGRAGGGDRPGRRLGQVHAQRHRRSRPSAPSSAIPIPAATPAFPALPCRPG